MQMIIYIHIGFISHRKPSDIVLEISLQPQDYNLTFYNTYVSVANQNQLLQSQCPVLYFIKKKKKNRMCQSKKTNRN